MSLTIRPWNAEAEAPLLYSSWLRSMWEDARARPSDMRFIRKGVLMAGQHAVIERLLQVSDVLVAELEGLAVGWLCWDGSVVHYGYVKEPYRGRGVFRALLAAAEVEMQPMVVSHLTRPVLDWRRKGRPVEFDPYAAVPS